MTLKCLVTIRINRSTMKESTLQDNPLQNSIHFGEQEIRVVDKIILHLKLQIKIYLLCQISSHLNLFTNNFISLNTFLRTVENEKFLWILYSTQKLEVNTADALSSCAYNYSKSNKLLIFDMRVKLDYLLDWLWNPIRNTPVYESVRTCPEKIS